MESQGCYKLEWNSSVAHMSRDRFSGFCRIQPVVSCFKTQAQFGMRWLPHKPERNLVMPGIYVVFESNHVIKEITRTCSQINGKLFVRRFHIFIWFEIYHIVRLRHSLDDQKTGS